MRYLGHNESIRNKKAREITYIKDSDQMKRMLRAMAQRGEIEGVPGAKSGGMAYRKEQKEPAFPNDTALLFPQTPDDVPGQD